MVALVINGQPGVDDNISSGSAPASDTLVSSTFSGDDSVSVFSSQYLVHLGEGHDGIYGGNGGTAWGEDGNDTMQIVMWQGTHIHYGGDGEDRITMAFGNAAAPLSQARAYGDGGHDSFLDFNPANADLKSWYGGSGFDVIELRGSAAMTVVLGGRGGAGGATNLLFSGIEGAACAGGNDTLTGSIADNLLIGGGGNDRLSGGRGDDYLIGDSRTTDFLNAYRGIKPDFVTLNPFDPLNNNIGGDWSGDSGGQADVLLGGDGNDVLLGGGGADALFGGSGRDWASYLSAPGGVAMDLSFGGTVGHAAGDTATSIENLQGSQGHDTLTGNDIANEIRGMSGNDSLSGRSGNDSLLGGDHQDTLNGGTDADVLTGGTSEDVFVFTGTSSLQSVDTITDMTVNFDTIWLSRSVFRGVGAAGADLAGSRFALGAATDAVQRIVYNDVTGALSYDADGSGAGAAVRFAQLSAGLVLTAADFFVIG